MKLLITINFIQQSGGSEIKWITEFYCINWIIELTACRLVVHSAGKIRTNFELNDK